MRSSGALLLLSLLLTHATPAVADDPPATFAAPPRGFTPTRIDPAIRNVLSVRAKLGHASPVYARDVEFERDGLVPVVVRFASPNDAGRYPQFKLLASGAFAGRVDAVQLGALEADPSVVRASCDLTRVASPILDMSAQETGVSYARPLLRKKDGTELDGHGVKIVDIDSGVLVFHPALFRADGGSYRWVDVNGDGKLTPGVDGVDLDGSGTIDATEKLRILSVDAPVRDGAFDAGVDYVYVDTNNNLDRDYGREFKETTPGLGEPIFVVDDVDRDGRLAVSEKLLRLGTSKVAALKANGRTYTRGAMTGGILSYGSSLLRDADAHRNADHGTSVSGILVGGVPERSKLLGLAPGAELMMAVRTGWTEGVQWAIDQKTDVLLTEMASFVGHPLDGSTEDDAMFDAAVDKGIAVVTPVGNLGDAHKHRSVKLAAGANVFPLETKWGFDNAPLVLFSVLHRGEARTLGVKITLGDGAIVDVPSTSTDAPVELEKSRMLTVTRRVSPRGTHELHIEILAYASTGGYGRMPTGKYSLSINADAPVDAELFATDSNTSWGGGLMFETNTVARTLCHPATNDRALKLAAYTLHGEAGSIAGTIASYSSSGPRIDGSIGIDLAAPANPWTTTVPEDPTYRSVHYSQFGGTSGAGPHAAAALALLKQLNPAKTGAELQKMLIERGRRDSFVDTPNRWGNGKVDVLGALELPRVETKPPRVHLAVPSPAPLRKDVELKVEVDAPGTAPLRARWDLDDDGKPDGDWEPLGSKTLRSDVAAQKDVRVDVLDAEGHLAGATARVVFAEPKAEAPPEAPAADADELSLDGGGCGCAVTERSDRGWLLAAGLALLAVRRRRS